VDVAQGEEKADREHVDHGGVRLPVEYAPLLHPSMGAQPCFLLVKSPIGKAFMLKTLDCMDCFVPGRNCGVSYNFPVMTRLVIVYLFRQMFKPFLIKLPRYILKFLIQCKEGRQTFVFLFRHVGRATAPGQYNDQIGHSYPMGCNQA
jgi:hypothetical protein